MAKKVLICISTLLCMCIIFSSCNVNSGGTDKEEIVYLSEEKTQELQKTSLSLAEYLNTGNKEEAFKILTEEMQDAFDNLLDVWKQMEAAGNFIKSGNYVGFEAQGFDILEMTIIFEKASFIQRTVFDESGTVTGLHFRNGEIKAEATADIPKNIIQEDAVIDAGEGYPLEGKLCLPKKGKIKAAVVLVHGSGPSDMDSTIGANKPFEDIAFGLAQENIAVLRYNKRTYSYSGFNKMGIEEETINDAVAAVNFLKEYKGINPEKVFILGHSMSGGLLSYININGADVAGYISLAGTPRKLWELSEAQNLMLADELEKAGDEENAASIREFVNIEHGKALKLETMSEEDALKYEETIFGMPAYYLMGFEKINTFSLHLQDEKPVLIVQGGKDKQVLVKDYELWQKELANHPNAEFKLYPELNHLMGKYTGTEVGIAELITVEYSQKTPVSNDVLSDIAQWIKNN